ncbi:hypothetical protein [Phenylobacterium sp.]|uniref:hypothetical protein n=1 Tax=Phenylobacterium sp. TaxID=1871053 RepID=UPI00301C75EB
MKMRQLGVCAAILTLAGPAAGQDREADWLRKPTAETLWAVFPVAAYQKGRSGRAIIACAVTVQGVLRDCRAESEEPQGFGFGAAAVALSPQFLMRPALRDGKPVESMVRIPINWDMSGMVGPFGPPPDRGDRVYTHLPWSAAPTVAQVVQAYPKKAREAGQGGTAVLACRIKADGGLIACDKVRETPSGLGLLSAARSLVPHFRTPTRDSKGNAVAGARAHVSVTFAPELLEQAPAVGRPSWRAVPSIEDLAAVIPPAARAAKVFRARVMMTCRVVSEGRVDGCSVESEAPEGLGYGAAAMSLTPQFRLAVWTDEGLPTVGGAVRIPLRFDLEALAVQEGPAPQEAAPPPAAP